MYRFYPTLIIVPNCISERLRCGDFEQNLVVAMVKMKPNPMRNANFLSLLTFWWMNDYFREGSKRRLEVTDIFELDPSDKSEEISNRLMNNWAKEIKEKKNPSLNRALAKTYLNQLLIGLFLTLIQESIRITLPILISQLIKYFENQENFATSYAYAYATAISVSSFAFVFFQHRCFYLLQRVGWHARVASCDLMFRKTLKLSQKSLNQTTTGQIVNLGATDVIRFDLLPPVINFLWILPLQLIVVGIILWKEVGASILAGLGLIVLLLIVQTANGKFFGKIRTKTAILTDKRIRLINEVITGIKIIKMYVWEKPIAKLVFDSRRKEINKILWSSALKAFNVSVYICTGKLSTFVTMVVYVSLGGSITASKVFLMIGLSQILSISSRAYCRAIQMLFESFSATERIQKYLLLDEIKTTRNNQSTDYNSSVELEDFTAKWQQPLNAGECREVKNRKTLTKINVGVKANKLLAVVGPVGAGKSSLLSAILGELPSTGGKLTITGTVVFANQVPWIFSGTVRENILFGEEFDSERFGEVIKACCLEKDLTNLPGGDLTIIGERGVTLSGGQKSRVSLARAAYRKDADIILMDDPLSAVDPPVAHHLFKNCISDLLCNKVRILVTHQIQLLKDADEIIVLQNGCIKDRGTYEKLKSRVEDFDYLQQNTNEHDPARRETTSMPNIDSSLPFKRGSLGSTTRSIESAFSVQDSDMNTEEAIPEEQREQGHVDIENYLEYFRVGSYYFTLGFLLLVMVTSHALYVLNDWWLAQWVVASENFIAFAENEAMVNGNTTSSISSNANNTKGISLNSNLGNFDSSYYLIIYAVIHSTMILMTLIRTNMHFYVCVKSGVHMHRKMFDAILRAPVRFFDTTPVGRILNRFSKDTGQVDELLPFTFMSFLYIFGDVVSMIILTSTINYFVILFVIPMAVYFIWLRKYFLQTSRELKRLEGSCRSPVFSFISSTLEGLVTVRAFGVQKRFEKNFRERQDMHSATWFLFLTGERWIGVRMDLVATAYISTVSFMCIVASSFLNLSSGEVGIILTYSVSMISLFQYGVRQSAEVETLMTSVERIQDYYRLPPEPPYEIPQTKPHNDWPTRGAITFENLSFAHYTHGPAILQDINVEIHPKEKIGLVGRTGAGKSSVIAALFRFSDFAAGEIYIDGIPISSLGLRDLRNAVSVIPQDPILFSGTVRRNLDPFSNYKDVDLWDAINQVQLREVIEALPLKLMAELSESGSNFSVGQRQLLCLARAILKQSKILVIDEATANVDLRTDNLIQVTIREKFKHCTVITIAHRINTIIDSDKIMVLDSGCLKEFGEPHILLQNPDGYFAKMVQSTGVSESLVLHLKAKEVYAAKHEFESGNKGEKQIKNSHDCAENQEKLNEENTTC